MNTRFLAAGLLLGGLVALPAVAAEKSGFFIYGELTRADVERAAGVSDRVDGNATGFTLGGGYNWSEFFAVRAGYRDFGNINATVGCPPEVFCVAIAPFATDKVELDGFVVELAGAYPLRDTAFALTGKLGLFDWDADWRNTPSLNRDGSEFIYGAGLRWRATDNLTVELGLEQSGFDTDAIIGGLSLQF